MSIFIECHDNGEAKVVSAAIANHLYWKRCECDHDTGYTCEHCHKHGRMVLDDEGAEFFRLQEKYKKLVQKARSINTDKCDTYKRYMVFDKEENEFAYNWDGTPCEFNGVDTVFLKGLGCNCPPDRPCGSCVDTWEHHKIGERFILKEVTVETI